MTKQEKEFRNEDYLLSFPVASKMFGAEKPEFNCFCTGFYAGLLTAADIFRIRLPMPEDIDIDEVAVISALSVIMEDFDRKIGEIERGNRLIDTMFGKKTSMEAKEKIYQLASEITERKTN